MTSSCPRFITGITLSLQARYTLCTTAAPFTKQGLCRTGLTNIRSFSCYRGPVRVLTATPSRTSGGQWWTAGSLAWSAQGSNSWTIHVRCGICFELGPPLWGVTLLTCLGDFKLLLKETEDGQDTEVVIMLTGEIKKIIGYMRHIEY